MLLLSDFLLQQTDTYNGHFQLVIDKIERSKVTEIISDLEASEAGKGFSFYLDESEDNSGSIYQKDFWTKGEHISGHTDRLILGFEKINN